jgi:hypothetical protein
MNECMHALVLSSFLVVSCPIYSSPMFSSASCLTLSISFHCVLAIYSCSVSRRNFAKFLCDADGVPVKRYGPQQSPLSFESDITSLISAGRGIEEGEREL